MFESRKDIIDYLIARSFRTKTTVLIVGGVIIYLSSRVARTNPLIGAAMFLFGLLLEWFTLYLVYVQSTRVQDEIEETQEEIEYTQSEVTEAQEQVEKTQQGVEAAKTRVEKTQKSVQEAKEDIEKAQRNITEAQDEIAETRTEILQTKKQVEDAKERTFDRISDSRSRSNPLEQRVKKLEDAVGTGRSSNRRSNLQARVKELERTIERLNRGI